MSEDEKAIRALVETWFAASRDGDVETVLSLMTDDVIFMVPGQDPFGREQFAAASKGMSGMKIDGAYNIQEIEIIGSEWAFMRNHIRMSMTLPGQDAPVQRSGYTLTLLRKADGRWRLARDANLLTME